MIELTMSPERVVNIIALIISVVSFIIVYNKAVRNRVDKKDLDELKTHVDKSDCGLSDRIDKVNERIDKEVHETHKMVTEIYKILIDKR